MVVMWNSRYCFPRLRKCVMYGEILVKLPNIPNIRFNVRKAVLEFLHATAFLSEPHYAQEGLKIVIKQGDGIGVYSIYDLSRLMTVILINICWLQKLGKDLQ